MSKYEKREEKAVSVQLSAPELRYLVSVGFAVRQHIPEKSLSTYTDFSVDEIARFSQRIRAIMDQNDISM